MPAKILFITGTDTGVGKTLFTALFLHYLRSRGRNALAMKPFCSGGREDIELLHELQLPSLSQEQICPFYFPEPVAPLVAARKHRCQITLKTVLKRIRDVADQCEYLLIEGVGGVGVPLGKNFAVIDLILALECTTVIMARNCLGTINHTWSTAKLLQLFGLKSLVTIMMGVKKADLSTHTNATVLSELLAPLPVFSVPFLGPKASTLPAVKRNQKRLKKLLQRVEAELLSPSRSL